MDVWWNGSSVTVTASHATMCELGYLHIIGWVVYKDVSRALDLYRKASDEGCAKGTFNVGLCYAYGWGVEVEYGKAVGMYRKACEMEHVEAIVAIGHRFETVRQVAKDVAKAVSLYSIYI